MIDVSLIADVSDSAFVRTFADACRSLEIRAQTVEQDLLSASPRRPIIAMTSGDPLKQQRLAETVKSANRFIALAVLEPGGSWSDALLDVVCDIAAWPCETEELAFRLGRITQEGHGLCLEESPTLTPILAGMNLIGASKPHNHCLRLIYKYSQTDAPVLISGETGTGKELTAQAIHYSGERSESPFVPLNCGSVPDDLFENELFGHEKGAFTDARGRFCGVVEQAERGTLFLDEVDALSPRGQVSLLRFLQDSQYRPLGGSGWKTADVRILAATNGDLDGLTARGEFRADLLYRLDVLKLKVPPLRDRAGDGEKLAYFFLEKFQRKYNKEFRGIGPDLLGWIHSHSWPGNVRELEHLVHRSVILSEGLYLSLVPDSEVSQISERQTSQLRNMQQAKAQVIEDFEKEYLQDLLLKCHGNVTEAASRSGKERRALGKLLKKYGIDRHEYR